LASRHLWNSALLDDTGYLWLFAVHVPGVEEKPEGWSCHVIDPEGRCLGTARLPVEKPRIRFGRLTGIQEDPETGAQRLVVYSIESAVRGVVYPR